MYHSTFKPPDRVYSGQCHFHPDEIFVGVCPLCLHERLLTLASLKPSHYKKHRSRQNRTTTATRGHSFSLTTKFLGLGSILNRLELRNHKTASSSFYDDQDCNSDSNSSSSREDTFISIKFEENGAAFWDNENKTEIRKTMKNKDSSEHGRNICVTAAERTKTQGGTYPWRKRIVRIFDQIRWKNVSNTNMVHSDD